MAKKRSTSSGKFAGETICFAGKAKQYSTTLDEFAAAAKNNGAKVVDKLDKNVTLLVLLPSGATAAAKKTAVSLQKKGHLLEVITSEEFEERCVPTSEETLAFIRAGATGHEQFSELIKVCRFYYHGRPEIELHDADFRKIQLKDVIFRPCDLNGADFREATLNCCEMGSLVNVRLEKATGEHFRPCSMVDCRCKGADLSNLFMGWHSHGSGKAVERVDFSSSRLVDSYWNYSEIESTDFQRANLTKASFESCKLVDCNFSGADLTDGSFKDTKCGKGVTFANAKLIRTDFRTADFTGVDLAGADMTGAILAGAKFKNANLERANLEKCIMFGASFEGVDTSKVKNFVPPTMTPTKIGPACRELAKAASGSEEMSIDASVQLPEGQSGGIREVSFCIQATLYGNSVTHKIHVPGKKSRHTQFSAKVTSFGQALKIVGETWGHGEVLYETVTTKSSKSPVKGTKLKDLVTAALEELFPGTAENAVGVKQKQAAARTKTKTLKAEVLAELLGGKEGVAAFNSRDKDELARKNAYEFKKANLEKANLAGLEAVGISFVDCVMDGASLKKANLSSGALLRSSLVGADISGSDLSLLNLTESNLQDANLSGTNMRYTTVAGTNMRGAKVARTKWSSVQFDERTVWPNGFKIPADFIFSGNGIDPRVSAVTTAAGEVTDLAGFLDLLRSKVNIGKLDKALKMLKKDRFQLFTEAGDDEVVGVVRSQTDKSLVYACRLNNSGSFSCCTQNLRACGGLKGSMCKHLLVLIIGLAQAAEVDPGALATWAELSILHKPLNDTDRMAEVLLKYQGAEAGELDWRPVETTPEDFYV